jgi:flagellar hook assembly protein FlgD
VTSGFRTFTAGEVLTASNVQNYLMDQSVMTFAGSAARSSAIGTANFEEGMTSYLKDTDKLEVYNGTNWVGVAPTTTQGLTLINTTSFSAVSSVSLTANTFNSTYTNYKILLRVNAKSGADSALILRLRASGTDSTTANYNYGRYGFRSNNTAYNFGGVSQTYFEMGELEGTSPDNFRYFFDINLSDVAVADYTSVFIGGTGSDSSSNYIAINSGGMHSIKTAYDSATIAATVGDMTGFYSVYGFNK